jgi:hypothetical protein
MTKNIIDHDVSIGYIDKCQVCHSAELELVIDLGHQPLSDSLRTKKKLNEKENFYPLRLYRCLNCTLAQLDYAVDGREVYHDEYPYRTGITRDLAMYQEQLSAMLYNHYQLDNYDLVVDIGSNDGTLLKGFKTLGARVLGVEPTNIVKFAIEDGIESIKDCFNEEVAQSIIEVSGKAKIITATNVFAHMTDLGKVMRGIKKLLDLHGVLVVESHYLVDILQKYQYDTIYHEHLRSYSLQSLMKLFSYYDMEIFHAEHVDRYAGNFRVHVAHANIYPIQSSVRQMLNQEMLLNLSESKIYNIFNENVQKSREKMINFAYNIKQEGKMFVGNSCPARSSTLLNYCGIDGHLMPYIAEQKTSLKKGLYLPGKHIPIVDNKILFEQQPDFVVLLAWHLADPIAKRLKEQGLKSKFIVPLPECKIYSV